VVRVPLTPGSFRPDFDRIRAAIGPRTRAILINTPHNPSGMVWSREEMLTLQDILAPTNVVLISDEVYEHMVYAPLQHWSAAQFVGLAGDVGAGGVPRPLDFVSPAPDERLQAKAEDDIVIV
jgi:methionine aminotransferase